MIYRFNFIGENGRKSLYLINLFFNRVWGIYNYSNYKKGKLNSKIERKYD